MGTGYQPPRQHSHTSPAGVASLPCAPVLALPLSAPQLLSRILADEPQQGRGHAELLPAREDAQREHIHYWVCARAGAPLVQVVAVLRGVACKQRWSRVVQSVARSPQASKGFAEEPGHACGHAPLPLARRGTAAARSRSPRGPRCAHRWPQRRTPCSVCCGGSVSAVLLPQERVHRCRQAAAAAQACTRVCTHARTHTCVHKTHLSRLRTALLKKALS